MHGRERDGDAVLDLHHGGVHVELCGVRRPELTVAGAHVDLNGKFHEAWLELAGRGRFVVLEKMAAKLCSENPGKRVDLTLDCRYLDRPAAHIERTDMCAHPEL